MSKKWALMTDQQLIDYFSTIPINKLDEIKEEMDDLYTNSVSGSLLTDDQYDILEKIWKTRSVNVPKVGAPVREDTKKVKLPLWMGSMDKKKEQDEISKWTKKYTSPYVVMPKLDGVSCMFSYNHGKINLYTRGDGSVGTDISPLQNYIRGIPKLEAAMSSLPSTFYIRGELMIRSDRFEKHHEQFKNARQLVSGIVNSKTIKKEVAKDIEFIPYEVILPHESLTITEQLTFLRTHGFMCLPHLITKKSDVSLTVEQLTKWVIEWKRDYPYYIDGIIIHSTEPYERNDSGNPSYAFAFKVRLDKDVVEANVVGVVWNVSKRGLLKPTVELVPVDLSGVTITFASGFNARFIMDNSIGKGAIVQLVRSGDVIPHIVSVVKKGKVNLPEVEHEWNETKVEFIVTDMENAEMAISMLTNFFKKINVKSLSTKGIEKMYENGLTSIVEILEADAETYGIGENNSVKIHDAIHTAVKNASISELISGSGILGSGMGERKIDALVAAIPAIFDEDYEVDYSEIVDIDGFSDKSATVVMEHIEEAKEFLESLRPWRGKKQVKKQKVTKDTTSELAGKNIVFSGFRDKALEEKLGIKTKNTVTKKTDILVVKDIATSSGKIEQAKEFGICVMEKTEFLEKFN